MASIVNSTKHSNTQITPILRKVFQRKETKEIISTSFYEAGIILIPTFNKVFLRKEMNRAIKCLKPTSRSKRVIYEKGQYIMTKWALFQKCKIS